jgi:hypothetical protein
MKTLLISIPAMLLFACGGGNPSSDLSSTKSQTKEIETPKALDDNSSGDVLSYSRKSRTSLVDELYEELVDKNPELQKIEDALVDIDKKLVDTKNAFNGYNAKSTEYYTDADYTLSSITDSTLKRQMRNFVNKSEAAYKSKTTNIKNLTALLDKGTGTISDHHTVLKIVATMPQIEQYQKDKLPPSTEYYNLVKEQQKLDNSILKNTPQH